MTAEKGIAKRIAEKMRVEGFFGKACEDEDVEHVAAIIRAELAPLLRAVDAVLEPPVGCTCAEVEYGDHGKDCEYAALRDARGGA